MKDTIMQRISYSSKSPLIFLSILGVLVISTLVMISSYFLRPSIEIDLKEQLIEKLSNIGINTPTIKVSGMDVTLTGTVSDQSKKIIAEETVKKIWGVRRVNNHLVVETEQND